MWSAGWHIFLPEAAGLLSEVQGTGAASSLRKGIEYFDSKDDIDVVIIGRGGGSGEDLSAFNDEALARSIAASKIPVISAVGHEVDVSISDFVADLRAPTPSAAAELAVFDFIAEREAVLSAKRYMLQAMSEKLLLLRSRIAENAQHFLYPEKILEGYYQRLDNLDLRLDAAQNVKFMAANARLQAVSGKLDALSPLKTLSRGYSIATLENGELIKDSKQIKKGDKIQIKFACGKAKAAIEEVK